MNIISVSAEVAPWSKTGGLGDVCGALPIALRARGHRVMTVAPRYKPYPEAWDTGVTVDLDGPKGEYRIRKAPNPQSLSSLETIATALEYLENTPHKYDTLREVLRARIDMQIQYIDPQIFQQNYPQST